MSLRLNALNLILRVAFKPILRHVKNPFIVRYAFEFGARLFLAGSSSYVQVAIDPPMVRHDPPIGRTSRAILYFHGGGFTAGSPETYKGIASRLAQQTGISIWMPKYRLAPEYPFPAAWDDVDAAFEALLGQGYKPHDIVLIGDSAGGGLAFSLLARLCAQGTPPAGVVGFSPWVDLTGTSASLIANRKCDPLLPAEAFFTLTRQVLAGQRADDPRASPLFAAYPNCPPVLFQVSDTEILRDDSLYLAERLNGFDARVTVQISHATPHAWQTLVGRLPEADAAVVKASRFVKSLWA